MGIDHRLLDEHILPPCRWESGILNTGGWSPCVKPVRNQEVYPGLCHAFVLDKPVTPTALEIALPVLRRPGPFPVANRAKIAVETLVLHPALKPPRVGSTK